MSYRSQILEYFAAEERGDVEAIVAMSAESVVVRNAASPIQHGKEGMAAYVGAFRDRTLNRQFTVLSIVENGELAFARWRAGLIFRAGISFGEIVTRRPFALDLDGICRFRFGDAGRFIELDVYHETSSAMRLANEAAEPNGLKS